MHVFMHRYGALNMLADSGMLLSMFVKMDLGVTHDHCKYYRLVGLWWM